MRKRTKKDLQVFKDNFEYWKREFGLTQYFTHFRMERCLDDADADILVNECGKTARVRLSPSQSIGGDVKADFEDGGQHEAVHLLLSRLVWLYANLSKADGSEVLLAEEEEAVVRRIQTALNSQKGTK